MCLVEAVLLKQTVKLIACVFRREDGHAFVKLLHQQRIAGCVTAEQRRPQDSRPACKSRLSTQELRICRLSCCRRICEGSSLERQSRASNRWRLSSYQGRKVSDAAAGDSKADVSYTGEVAVVVGAGPAGSAVAVYLARNGFTVKVFDKRGDLRKAADLVQRRYYSIVPGGRGVAIMQDVGVKLPTEKEKIKSGLCIHMGRMMIMGGKVVKIPAKSPKVSGSRKAIAAALLDALEAETSDIELNFNHECKEVSFENREAKFQDAEGEERVVHYDLLIGADGASSYVRGELQRFDKQLRVEVIQNETRMLSLDSLTALHKNHPFAETMAPGWFAGWFVMKGKENEKASLICTLSSSGCVRGVVAANYRAFEAARGREKEWIDAVLPSELPQEWKQIIVDNMIQEEPFRSSDLIKVSKFNGPRTVLVGDAAHSVFPGLGQGCGMGLEDAQGLDEVLRQSGGQTEAVPQLFTDLRLADVRASQLLEQGVSWNAKLETWTQRLWKFVFVTHAGVYAMGQRLFPWAKIRPPMDAFRSYEISSRRVLFIIQRDCVGFMALCAALFLLVTKTILHFLGH